MALAGSSHDAQARGAAATAMNIKHSRSLPDESYASDTNSLTAGSSDAGDADNDALMSATEASPELDHILASILRLPTDKRIGMWYAAEHDHVWSGQTHLETGVC